MASFLSEGGFFFWAALSAYLRGGMPRCVWATSERVFGENPSLQITRSEIPSSTLSSTRIHREFHTRSIRNMTTDLMGRIKKSFGSDSRPEIPLARPESRSNTVSGPEETRTQPRVHFKGWTTPSSDGAQCASQDVRDAAHSPPSVLGRYLGPPVIEHKYPQDSKWRRHSISAQEQYYTRG